MVAESVPVAGDRPPTGERPFSNGTEFDIWADRYCYRCVKDSISAPPGAEEKFCPILTAALHGADWPEQWTRREHHWQIGDSSGSYEVVDTCTEFEERRDDGGGDEPEPDPGPPPVCEGQLDLVDAYLDTAVEELTRAPVTA